MSEHPNVTRDQPHDQAVFENDRDTLAGLFTDAGSCPVRSGREASGNARGRP